MQKDDEKGLNIAQKYKAVDTNLVQQTSLGEESEKMKKTSDIDEIDEELDDEFEEDKPVKKSDSKSDGKSLPLPGCSCRSCGCYGCLLIILTVVLFGAIVYFRPPFVWNPIKNYLNQGYDAPEVEDSSASQVRDQVKLDVENKKVDITLTEVQLQSLVKDKFESDEYFIDIEPSYIRLVRNIDSSSSKALWLIFEVGQTSDENLEITKFGFERIDSPDFLKKAASESIFSVLDLGNIKGENDAVRLVNLILNSPDIQVESVRFDKDQITIQAKAK